MEWSKWENGIKKKVEKAWEDEEKQGGKEGEKDEGRGGRKRDIFGSMVRVVQVIDIQ